MHYHFLIYDFLKKSKQIRNLNLFFQKSISKKTFYYSVNH